MEEMTDREKEIFRQTFESGYKQGFEAGKKQSSAYYEEKYRELAKHAEFLERAHEEDHYWRQIQGDFRY